MVVSELHKSGCLSFLFQNFFYSKMATSLTFWVSSEPEDWSAMKEDPEAEPLSHDQ